MASNFERTVYIIELRDRFSMGMNRATTMTNRFNRSMVTARTNTNLLTSAMRGLAIGAAAGAAYGIARVTTQIVKLAAELETTTVAFEVMLRSASKAQSLVSYGMEFARTTPFTQRQVFGNMRQLLAYGAPEQNVRGYNRMLSTIAAGVGMERLPFLTLALGQVIAKGRLQGQELRQFTEHGVPVVGMLSQRMGISTSDVYEEMRKGRISSQMVVDAMMAMTKEGGLFQGMLERLRETFTGTFNVMKSTWQIYLMDAVTPLKNGLKSTFEFAIDLAEAMPRLDGAFSVLKQEAIELVSPFRELAKAFKELTGLGIIDLLVGGVNTLTTVLVSMGNVIKTFAISLISPLLLLIEKTGLIKAIGPGFTENLIRSNALNYQQKIKDIWGIGDMPTGGGTKSPTGIFNIPGMKPFNAQWKGFPFPYPGTTPKVPGMVPLWSGGKLDGEDEDTVGGKKRVANRLIGTGARDIVIHIGNLIENMQISSPSMGESAEQLTERVKMAMLTAINDASILADR